MYTKKLGLLLAVSVLGMAQAYAGNVPSYSYLEASYSSYDSGSNNSNNLDGFGLKASFALNNNLFVQGGYENIESDVDTFYGGVGYQMPLSSNSSFFVRGDLIHTEVLNFNDTGYGLGLGVRAMLAPNVELAGEYNYANIFDNGSSTLKGEARYSFTQNFSVGAGYEADLDSNLDRWIFSGRVGF